MATGFFALLRISPKRVAALTAVGYAVRVAAKYPSCADALARRRPVKRDIRRLKGEKRV